MDLKTGQVLWRAPVDSSIKHGLAVWQDNILAITQAGTLYCFDPQGKPKWSTALAENVSQHWDTSFPVTDGRAVYTGRAAALLMVLIKPAKVYTPIISEGAREVFQQYDIPFETLETVKYLMGVASDGMCQWEKKALGKSPEEFWKMIKPE